jgi:hypothetical protein
MTVIPYVQDLHRCSNSSDEDWEEDDYYVEQEEGELHNITLISQVGLIAREMPLLTNVGLIAREMPLFTNVGLIAREMPLLTNVGVIASVH